MRNKQNRLHFSKITDILDPVRQKTRHYERFSELYQKGFDWVTWVSQYTGKDNNTITTIITLGNFGDILPVSMLSTFHRKVDSGSRVAVTTFESCYGICTRQK
jgi:hypothetical protein